MKKTAYESSGVSLGKAKLLAETLSDVYDNDNLNAFSGIAVHPMLDDYFFTMTTDGIGTKLMPLLERRMYSTIANDLVAMNLNDLACVGATPIGFADYISCHELDVDVLKSVITELSAILSKYNCKLLSGETSETPKLLAKGLMDIAGCASGMVKKDTMLGKHKVKSGNIILGLCSSGVHSNGFSLLIDAKNTELLSSEEFEQTLSPTVIYIKEVLDLCSKGFVNCCAHITGGGLEENLKRVIPENLGIVLNLSAIPKQPIFVKLEQLYGEEAWSVFNMGVGFCLVLNVSDVKAVLELTKMYNPFVLGKVVLK